MDNFLGRCPALHKRMSGALPPTPPPAFEKAGPKLFYGKVLWGEQRAVNIEYSVFARPAYCLLGNVFMLFSGRCPVPHKLLKKLDQNFSTEKFYGANSVRSIQNIAYLHRTVYGSAARRLLGGIFSAYGRCFAETFSIKYAFAPQKRTS